MAITRNGAIPAAAGVGDVTLTGAQTLTNKTLTSPVVSGLTLSDGSLVLEGATANDFETTIQVTDPTADRTITIPDATTTLVGTDTTQTLTNKTLTSPVLGGTSTSASGNIVVKPATNILEVQGDNSSVVGQIQLNCHVNTHGQKIASQPHAQSATNTLTLPGGSTIGNSNAVLVSDTGTQTLTNKTLSGAVLSGTLTAGGSVGTAGQVLTSTGSGVEYATPSAGTTANDQAFAFAVQVFA